MSAGTNRQKQRQEETPTCIGWNGEPCDQPRWVLDGRPVKTPYCEEHARMWGALPPTEEQKYGR